MLVVPWALPSPKFQSHEVGLPLELSKNVTFSGRLPVVGAATNDAWALMRL